MKPIELFHDAPLLPEEGWRCQCRIHSDCCSNDYKPAGYDCFFEAFQFDARHHPYPTRYLDDRLPAIYPFGPEDDPNEVAMRVLTAFAMMYDGTGGPPVPLGAGPNDKLVEYENRCLWVRGGYALIKMRGPNGRFNLGAIQPVLVMHQTRENYESPNPG